MSIAEILTPLLAPVGDVIGAEFEFAAVVGFAPQHSGRLVVGFVEASVGPGSLQDDSH